MGLLPCPFDTIIIPHVERVVNNFFKEILHKLSIKNGDLFVQNAGRPGDFGKCLK